MIQTSRHFSALTQAFLAEGGTVDKYIGDSVMVFRNAPHPQPDHVARACRAALAARAASDALNAQFEIEKLPPFSVRLGINSGIAVARKCGFGGAHELHRSRQQREPGGPPRRAEPETRTTILVSEAVRDRAEHLFRFNPVASVVAKGMTQETRVYELIDAVT